MRRLAGVLEINPFGFPHRGQANRHAAFNFSLAKHVIGLTLIGLHDPSAAALFEEVPLLAGLAEGAATMVALGPEAVLADLPKRATDKRSEDFLKFVGRQYARLLERPGDQGKQRACHKARCKCRGHCGYIAAGRY